MKILIIIGLLGLAILGGFAVSRSFRANRTLSALHDADEIRVLLFRAVIDSREDQKIADLLNNGEIIRKNDQKEVNRVVDMFSTPKWLNPFKMKCRCHGDYILEFRKNGQIIASIGFAHGHHLKRVPGVLGDIALTPDSAANLTKWIKQNEPANL